MASPILGRFDTWLSEKLLNLNQDVDLDVFVSYISGILEADTPEDEKSESLFGILGELVQSSASIEDECQEIIKKWKELSSEDTESKTNKDVDHIDFKIHSIIEQQNASQASQVKPVSRESQERKAVILAQYAEISDGEDLDDVPGEGKAVASASSGATASATSTAALSNEELLVKNMNALLVKERERTERDRAKQEAEHKKQKDKEDRERQKSKAQERKETEKKRTQKGDKKR